MKHLTKSITLLIVFLLFTSNISFAAGTTKLEKVEDPLCTINSQAVKLEKQMIEFNESTKDLTIQLRVQNIKEVEYANEVKGEYMFLIDNSQSTTELLPDGTTTRREAILSSFKSLVDKLFAANPEIKIGVVSFSSLDNSKGETEGTINDAKLRTTPTSDKSVVVNALNSITNEDLGPRTNLEAGLTIAQQNFSQNSEIKNLVILSDGLPNNAVGGPTLTYSGETTTKTRAKLAEINASGVNIFTILTGVNPNDMSPADKTYRELTIELFGQPSNPDYGFFFNIADTQIEETLTDAIFYNNEVLIDNSVSNITVTDVIPQEILDNFTFEYVSQPTHGTISQTVDPQTRSITWNIPKLKEGETATVSYKLSLKETYDPQIIDKVLPTNEKVDISYDYAGNTIPGTTSETPKVVVRFNEEKIPDKPQPNTPVPDNTIANVILPQTGEFQLLGLFILSGAAIIGVLYFKSAKYKVK